MKYFKILADSFTGLKGNHLPKGNVYPEYDFCVGHCPALVEQGFIQELTADEIDAHLNPKEAIPAAPKMIDHVVTEADLLNNPELAEQGVKVGETIQLPETEADDAALAAANTTAPEVVDTVDLKITKKYLEEHPELAAEGKKVGETIQVPNPNKQ